MRRTKIVATIGPAFDSKEGIERMVDAGVDVIRFNMKHNTLDWHSERMEVVENVCQEKHKRVAMLIDLQGPEVRIDNVPEKFKKVKPGDKVTFTCADQEGGISLDHPEIFDVVNEGGVIFADDGFLEFKVLSKGERNFETEVIEGGEIKPRKTVNFPGAHLDFPALIEKDIEHLSLATRHHIDFVALSFVRNTTDIDVLREELKKHDIDCQIIAKIEHPDAVEHFDEILDVADGIMVARGDLGIEYPMEEVPGLQKMMVRRCREEGKPVIIATQMLESMENNIRPTRAEVSDVANAAYDSADALMLSGETAMGKHPARVVKTMAKIAEKVDHSAEKPEIKIDWDHSGQTAAVVSAAFQLMKSGYRGACDLQAFVVLTETGKTAHYLSRLRPELPIFALSQYHETLDQLKLSWGVIPTYCEEYSKDEKLDDRRTIDYLKSQGLLDEGKQVIMIYGEVMGKPGLTSVVRVQKV
ncbi:pyruvate kinase [Patescibacteria group bacterium]